MRYTCSKGDRYTYPIDGSEHSPRLSYGDAVALSWAPIPSATGYHLELYEVKCCSQLGGVFPVFGTADTAMVYGASLAGTSTPIQGWTSPASGSDVYGYWYTVRAQGPGGLSPTAHDTTIHGPLGPFGGQRGDHPYFIAEAPIEATALGFDTDAQGRVLFDNSAPDVADHYKLSFIAQQSLGTGIWSPSGTYDFELFVGDDCVDGLQLVDEPQVGNLVTAFLGPFHGLPFSWHIRAAGTSEFHVHSANQGWLNCLNFQMSLEAEQQQNDCGNSVLNGSEQCDEGANNGGPTCTLDCKTPPAGVVNCGEVVNAGGGATSFSENIVVDLEGTEGTFWFAYDTAVVPDRIEVRRGNAPYLGAIVTTSEEMSGIAGGCVGGQRGGTGGTAVTLVPGSNFINVTIYPNCSGTTDTAWAFLVDCVGSGATPPTPAEN